MAAGGLCALLAGCLSFSPGGGSGDGDGDGDPDASVEPTDRDDDGVDDPVDNCPDDSNPDQLDEDGDGVGNLCDLCPAAADDQSDSDADAVGDACDPQPGQANALLFFEAFDAPLDTGLWSGDGWAVGAGGALVHADNSRRDFLRYTGVDASDNVVVVARAEFRNPLGLNGVALRFGGVFAEANAATTNNGCWVMRALNNNSEGYTVVNADQGSISYTAPVAAAVVEDSPYEIALTLQGNTATCAVTTDDGAADPKVHDAFADYTDTDLGLVASFTEMRVEWIYALRLQ